MAKRRNKGEEKHIARKRIDVLLAAARSETLGPDRDLADQHAGLALRVARRYQATLRPDQKAQVCRKCGAYRTHDSSRVRLRAGKITTTCLRCGAVHRRPLAPRTASAPPAPAAATPAAGSAATPASPSKD